MTSPAPVRTMEELRNRILEDLPLEETLSGRMWRSVLRLKKRGADGEAMRPFVEPFLAMVAASIAMHVLCGQEGGIPIDLLRMK